MPTFYPVAQAGEFKPLLERTLAYFEGAADAYNKLERHEKFPIMEYREPRVRK